MQRAVCVWGGEEGNTGKMKQCYFVDEMLIFYVEDRPILSNSTGGFWLFANFMIINVHRVHGIVLSYTFERIS